MIPISKALKIVNRMTKQIGVESVKLSQSVGRVLAEDIVADTDLPPFDRSQMDGYAVKAKDTANAPVALKIVGESAAGHGWHKTLGRGEAVRIMTGAPVPAGADAVQKLELTNESGGEVRIHEAVKKGKNIVRRGAEVKKGARVFRKGEIVTDRMIASLASFGYAEINVHRRPLVSILSTGSEIVPIDKKPGRDQIRNSNSVMIKALCENAGAAVKVLPQTGDDLEKLKRTISKAIASSDILVITGGVSVGKYDLTKPALRELGAEIFFERVRLKPGKPTVFAKLGDTLIFGLPGNPVSAAVTFYVFVRNAIMLMQGASRAELASGTAVVPVATKGAKDRDTYLPASLSTDASGRLLATPLRWQGSSDFIGFARADALIFVPAGEVIAESTAARIVFLNS